MQGVLQEAELSAGAVYRYFPDKNDIVEAIATHALARGEISADVPAHNLGYRQVATEVTGR
ncbi:TetR family transcriptional regulator [Actinopolymorpha sp. NPDC004070]|uniref:TetR family transcriptional regulator n=1 Tax=Actinopolymorpha sp. NPDC004070 TaxID=3154548 RepID=UPI0033B7AA5B